MGTLGEQDDDADDLPGLDWLALYYPGLSVGLALLVAIVAVSGSFGLLFAFDHSARSYQASGHPVETALFMSLPFAVAGLISFLMTRGSRLCSNAGVLAALVLAAFAILFACWLISTIGSWGGDMQALAIFAELALLCVVALLTPLGAYIFVRIAYSHRLPAWKRDAVRQRQDRELDALKKQRHW
jgi:multisubunit Na+/H+ antiporter MnhG subunit